MDHALTRWSKGSVRDRLCLPDCLRASGPGSYIVPLRWRGGRQRRHFNAAKGGIYAHRSEGAIPQPSAQRAVKPENPQADRPVKPGNLLHNPFAQPAADRRPQPAAQPRPPLFNLRHSRHHNPQRQSRCQTLEPSSPSRKALRSGRRGEIDILLSWRGGISLRPAGLLLLRAVFWPVPVLRPARRFLLLLFLPYPGSSLLRE